MLQTENKISFAKNIGFRKELNRRVDAYLEANQITTKDNPAMYVKIALILGWVIASATFTLFGPNIIWMKVLGCMVFGLSIAGVGFNIAHDANHGSCSNRNWVNKILSVTFDIVGASSYLWRIRHNLLHHTYTNVLGYDVEIHGDGLVRMSPYAERKWFHQFQEIFIYFIYPIIPLYWSFTDVYLILFKRKYYNHVIQAPKTSDLAILLGGKFIWLGLFLGIPIAVGYTPLQALAGFLIAYLTDGLIMCIVFMLAHVMDTAEFIQPNPESNQIEDEWAIFQVKTTVDFAPTNPIVTWYLGGLNYQVVHHLFPQIHHIHYPKIAPIVAEVCQEFGVKYNVCETVGEALVSNYRWMKILGQKPQTSSAV